MMRRWIARKLFDLVAWLDWDEAVRGSYAVVFADMVVDGVIQMPPKKRTGRPKGAKDGVGPKAAPKKIGRPLGSKNKPKVTA